MKSRAAALMQRRDALIARITSERDLLAIQGAALRPTAQLIDKFMMGIRFVKSHPAALLLPMTMLALWHPRRLLGFALSSLGGWRLLQQRRHRLRS